MIALITEEQVGGGNKRLLCPKDASGSPPGPLNIVRKLDINEGGRMNSVKNARKGGRIIKVVKKNDAMQYIFMTCSL